MYIYIYTIIYIYNNIYIYIYIYIIYLPADGAEPRELRAAGASLSPGGACVRRESLARSGPVLSCSTGSLTGSRRGNRRLRKGSVDDGCDGVGFLYIYIYICIYIYIPIIYIYI